MSRPWSVAAPAIVAESGSAPHGRDGTARARGRERSARREGRGRDGHGWPETAPMGRARVRVPPAGGRGGARHGPPRPTRGGPTWVPDRGQLGSRGRSGTFRCATGGCLHGLGHALRSEHGELDQMLDSMPITMDTIHEWIGPIHLESSPAWSVEQSTHSSAGIGKVRSLQSETLPINAITPTRTTCVCLAVEFRSSGPVVGPLWRCRCSCSTPQSPKHRGDRQ
jgi:hypothetical protein